MVEYFGDLSQILSQTIFSSHDSTNREESKPEFFRFFFSFSPFFFQIKKATFYKWRETETGMELLLIIVFIPFQVTRATSSR